MNRELSVATRYCPKCGAVPGEPCVYLEPWPTTKKVHTATALAARARTGQPCETPHNERGWSERRRLLEWLRTNGHILWEEKS